MKNIKSQGNGEQPAISRRHFIQASSALIALPFVSSPATAQARAVTATENRPAEEVVQTCSTFDCGGKCDIRAHVSDGIVTRISTRPDNALDAQMPVMRACVRGRAYRKFAAGPEMPDNPVKAKISVMNWVQAADDASKVTPDMGLKDADKLDSNIRILFSLAGNYLANQNPDLHQAVRVLEDESKIQFIVASDLFMTPSAKYADLLLPETSFMERWNIGETWGTASYLILSEKLIEPEFERRSDYDWLREVAAKLGIENEFSQGRDEKAWIEHIWEQTRLAMPDENLPDFATLQKTRQHLFKSAPFIAFEDNIRDPENHPFPTPSGKIEIFSKRLYDMQHPEIPALSHYVPAHEGPEDALAKDFPLQLITWKGKNRANSTQYANPWLIEVQQQTLWINPQDAQTRGITHGDMVRIHNSRGICEIPAEVTPRIIPGVVAMQAGAWWQPDENGIDKGGCANVLSSARITALAKGNSHQTMLVEVAKA